MRLLLPALMLLLAIGGAGAEGARQALGAMLTIVPPDGFVLEDISTSKLVDKATGGSISVVDRSSGLFEQVAADTDVARLNQLVGADGIIVEQAEMTTLDGHDALLMRGRQQKEGVDYRKWMAVIRAERAIFITVEAPIASAPDDAAVLAVLGSIKIGSAPTNRQKLAILPYRLTEMGSFRPLLVDGTKTALTIGNKDVVSEHEQPIVIVAFVATPIPAEGPPMHDIAVQLLQATNKTLTLGRIVSETGGDAASPNRHELVAEAEDPKSGARLKVIQWVDLFPSGILLSQGVARRDVWDDVAGEMRRVHDGIEMKDAQ